MQCVESLTTIVKDEEYINYDEIEGKDDYTMTHAMAAYYATFNFAGNKNVSTKTLTYNSTPLTIDVNSVEFSGNTY